MNIFGESLKVTKTEEQKQIEELVATFGKLVNKKIDATRSGNGVSISKNEQGGYVINLPTDKNEFSNYNHTESLLSRVVWKSKHLQHKALVRRLASEYRACPAQAIDAMDIIAEELERRRCESLWGEIYRGSNRKFTDERSRVLDADLLDKKDVTPHDAFMAAIYGDEEKLDGKLGQLPELAQAVDFRDENITESVLEIYWRSILRPWMEEQQEQHDSENNQRQNESKEPLKTPQAQTELARARFKTDKEYISMQAGEKDAQKYKEILKAPKTRLKRSDKKKTINDIKGELEKSKERAEEQVEKIQDKMQDMVKDLPQPDGNTIEIHRERTSFVEGDTAIQRAFSNVLKIIRERRIVAMDEDGDELDTDELIQRRITRDGRDVFWSSDIAPGCSIVLSIDASQSMQGRKISNCMTIAASLMDACRKLKNVDLKVVWWTGVDRTGKAGCVVSHKRDEVGLVKGISMGGTPTHDGMRQSMEVLRKMNGIRKYMLVLTDGFPADCRIGGLDHFDAVNKLVRDNKRRGINTVGISLEGNGYTEYMRKMFGKDYFHAPTIDDARTILSREVQRILLRSA